jgi:hypothetical protein
MNLGTSPSSSMNHAVRTFNRLVGGLEQSFNHVTNPESRLLLPRDLVVNRMLF